MKKIDCDSENSNRMALCECKRLLGAFHDTAAGRRAEGLHSKPVELMFDADEILDTFDDPAYNHMVTVLGKFQVTPMLYHLVACHLGDIKMNLIDDCRYTADELIGDADWEQFKGPARREMELCLKHFATLPESYLMDSEKGYFTLK